MIVVRRRLPEGRLQLVVVEAEDLVIGRKGTVDPVLWNNSEYLYSYISLDVGL